MITQANMQTSSPEPRLSRRLLVVALAIVAITGSLYVILRWNARHNLEVFLRPSPVPSDLTVLDNQGTVFSRYYHFTGPPKVIASIMELKGLVEVPAEPSDPSEMTGFSAKERSKISWDWWQPAEMEKPRFFFLHHTSETAQGWSEGWWVSGDTNEVFAFVSG